LNELEVEFKYKALNCEISELSTDSGDYLSLIKTIKGEDPADEESIINKLQVLNVYKIKRSSEDAHFTNTIFNRKLLFHGSRIGKSHTKSFKSMILISLQRIGLAFFHEVFYFRNESRTSV
jgi:hypothetical protein